MELKPHHRSPASGFFGHCASHRLTNDLLRLRADAGIEASSERRYLAGGEGSPPEKEEEEVEDERSCCEGSRPHGSSSV